MSLTQVDKDFLTIREKIITENETFLKKFQNNLGYLNYKKKYKRSAFLPIFFVVLFAAIVGVSVYFLYKYFPKFYLYEFIGSASLILLSFMFLVIKFTKKIKQEKSTNKTGFYNSVMQIENCYDKLTTFINSINLSTSTDEEKLKFYTDLEKVFATISSKLSKVYSNKSAKIKKLSNSLLDWNWLLKYLYNFGKFCYNKKTDCKTFVKLLSI